MLHPSYTELIDIVNSNQKEGEKLVVNSRYSIVMATSKRARQIAEGHRALVDAKCPKPLSVAIAELEYGETVVLKDGTNEELRKIALAPVNYQAFIEDDSMDEADEVPVERLADGDDDDDEKDLADEEDIEDTVPSPIEPDVLDFDASKEDLF